jgi:hypothetical protein
VWDYIGKVLRFSHYLLTHRVLRATATARLGARKAASYGRLAWNRAFKFARTHEWRPWKHLELSEKEQPRAVLISAALGAVLVGISFVLYFGAVSPPQPPNVHGSGDLFVNRSQVLTRFSASFNPSEVLGGRSHVDMNIVFYGSQAKPIRWALVLYGDARLLRPSNSAFTFLPPGTSIKSTRAGDPAFSGNPKVAVQVISGTSYPAYLNGHASAVLIRGWLPVAVITQSGPTFSLSLPRYGRVEPSPLFQFPKQPGAYKIGIPGTWMPPDHFEVDVSAGDNNSNQQIDIASPSISDPTKLAWASGTSVQAVLRRTDLHKNALQQAKIFLLGALVGAGGSSIVISLERVLTHLKPRVAGA